MNDLALLFSMAIFMGLGATLAFDLWGVFLKKVFNVPPSNFCLVGRWLRYMPDRVFRHANIGSAPHKPAECTLGWLAHYTIGIVFAAAFVAFAGESWLQHPTPMPAIVFGVLTAAAPFLILQPALGLGVAASKTSHPGQARLRSLMNHLVFGAGLYIFGSLANHLL